MKRPWTNTVIAGCAGLLVLFHIFLGGWKNPDVVFRSDAADYYVYLPAGLIFRDASLGFLDRLSGDTGRSAARMPLENGNVGIKMSMGLAILHAPFFLIGHGVAGVSDSHPANGYSLPYAVSIVSGALIYFLLGLYCLGRALEGFFDDRVVALTLLAMSWGTNVTYYLLRKPAMSHGYSFCLFAAFLWLTVAWHRRPTRLGAVGLGLVFGLITLVRPTNGVVALVFGLWGVGGFSDLIRKAELFRNQAGAMLLIGIFAMLVWTPQFLYWKHVAGHWLHYSYGDEGFRWLSPRMGEVVLGFRKGWLIYTPTMVFALLGLIPLYRHLRSAFWSVFIYLLVNIYVVSSWWCWWYGGSLGQRALIESSAILAFPLAMLIQRAFGWGRKGWLGALGLAGALVLHNGFQIIQVKPGPSTWKT